MSSQDVADALGIKRTSVHKYVTRGDLPEPDDRIGRSPVWKRETVESWVAARRGHGWRKGRTGSHRDGGQDAG